MDLGAYDEDPSELGTDESATMQERASICLYMIADRLVLALLADADEEN